MYIKGYRNIYIRWKNQFILRARISGGGPTPTGRRLRQKGWGWLASICGHRNVDL